MTGTYDAALLSPAGSTRRSVSLITPTFTSSSTGLGTHSNTPGATCDTNAGLSGRARGGKRELRLPYLLLVLDAHAGVGVDLEEDGLQVLHQEDIKT